MDVVVADYYQKPGARSFNALDDWTTDRAGQNTATELTSGVYYVNRGAAFTDAPPEGASLIVADKSSLSFPASATKVVVSSLVFGSGTTLSTSGQIVMTTKALVDSGAKLVNVIVFERGGALTSFAATNTGYGSVRFDWRVDSDEPTSILIERREEGEWRLCLVTEPGTTAEYTFEPSGPPTEPVLIETWRAWDGDAYVTVYSEWNNIDFYQYQSVVVVSSALAEWTTVVRVVRANEMGYRNENALFLALIRNNLKNELLKPEDVTSISATLYKVTGNWSAADDWTEVEGWRDVVVPTSSVLETPMLPESVAAAGVAWPEATGPNFAWTPDSTERSLFSEGGRYVMQVRILLTDGRNPVVLTFNSRAE